MADAGIKEQVGTGFRKLGVALIASGRRTTTGVGTAVRCAPSATATRTGSWTRSARTSCGRRRRAAASRRRRARGRDCARKEFVENAGRTFTEFGFTPETFVDADDADAVVVIGRFEGEGVEGARLDEPGVQIWEFQGNAVSRVRVFTDSAGFPDVVTERKEREWREEKREKEEKESAENDESDDSSGATASAEKKGDQKDDEKGDSQDG